MIRRALVSLGLAGLAACSPEPRSASYFEAHREEAARVAAACTSGAHRGQECVNAEAGVKAARDEAVMAYFHKAF